MLRPPRRLLSPQSCPMVLLFLLLLRFLLLPKSSFSASVATVTTESYSSSAASSSSINRRCVVVGGGPVGLAAALTLSNPPHSYNVVVLEQTEGKTAVGNYNPTRAYNYNVNPRGLKWVRQFPRALEKLIAKGSSPPSGYGEVIVVHADPTKPISKTRSTTVSVLDPAGPKLYENSSNYFDPTVRTVWISRHELVGLLQECCMEQEEKRTTEGIKDVGSIQLLSGKKVDSLFINEDDETVMVRCADGSTYGGGLIVGADGINSVVRSCLANTSADRTSWLHSRPRSFRVKKHRSPSTGLRLKALQFPSNFTLQDTDGSILQTKSETVYILLSDNKGTRNKISLGILPVKNPNLCRPANIKTRWDHEMWTLDSGEAAKEWFHMAFPRIPFDRFIDDTEWDRFAQAEGTTFPYCQYSPGSALASPDHRQGVVLVGDSCHAFPPDIGNGINAGLLDVVALDRALCGHDIITGDEIDDKPATLGAALAVYEKNRRPEHKALIRLARFGSPYQYRQSWRRDQVGSALWTLNVWIRNRLHRASFGLIPPASFLVMQKHNLTFRQVMRRVDATVVGMRVAVVVAALLLVRKRLHS